MDELLKNLTSFDWVLIGSGVFVMGSLLIRTLTQGTVSTAAVVIEARRAYEAEIRSRDAVAEAIGRAAAREPLALNADGTIMEPIMAAVERPGIS